MEVTKGGTRDLAMYTLHDALEALAHWSQQADWVKAKAAAKQAVNCLEILTDKEYDRR
jgi:hypothetical protein